MSAKRCLMLVKICVTLCLALVWVNFHVDTNSADGIASNIGMRVNVAGTMDAATSTDVLFPAPIKHPAFDFPAAIKPTDKQPTDTDQDGVPDALDRNPNFTGVLSNIIYRVPLGGKIYVFRLNVAPDYVDVYRVKMPHALKSNGENVANFVVRGEPYVVELVDQAKAYEKQDPQISAESLLLALAQNIPYNADAYTGKLEYPKYPIETLVDQSGDCEDLSILTVNLIGELKGYDQAAFVFFGNHMGIGILSKQPAGKGQTGQVGAISDKDRTYIYQETTDAAWARGQIPDAYRKRTPIVYRVI